MKDNVYRNVFKKGLCHNCGVCQISCPTGAIKMTFNQSSGFYYPKIDENKCIECALCLKTCSGISFPKEAYKFENSKKSDFIGSYSNCFMAYSNDEELRFNSSSGGAVTSILLYLLSEGKIDGALVIDSYSLIPKSFIARTEEEIINAKGSKYCSVNLSDGLEEIIQSQGRYAVVGLPCHFHSLKLLNNAELNKKIILRIGLFCANSNSLNGTKYFLKKNGIDFSKVESIKYRSCGWPGKISVSTNSQNYEFDRGPKEESISKSMILSSAFHYNFIQRRCLFCFDQTSEYSDISVGDPWVKEIKEVEKKGLTLIVVRNPTVFDLFDKQIFKFISLRKFDEKYIPRCQNFGFKKSYGGRIALFKILGFSVPEYDDKFQYKISKKSRFLHDLRHLTSVFTNKRLLWFTIKPISLFHHYSVIHMSKLLQIKNRFLKRGN